MLSPGIELVDSHCHLDFPVFNGKLPDVVDRATRTGVTRMLTIATSLSSEPEARAIAERFASVFFAVGTHPHRVAQEPMITVDDLVQISRHPKMVAIGESGLDYHYTRELAELQKDSLRVHIDAARATGLPLIVHARSADDDIGSILEQEFEASPYTCVMHCYSSSAALAELAVRMGFYLSMSGIVTFRNAEALRAIFSKVPIEQVLVETDAPYLAPVPYRGKTNEPSYTLHTAIVGASLYDMTLDEFASITTRNFDRVFTKAAGKGLSG